MSRFRPWKAPALTVLAMLLMVIIRVATEGRSELALGDAAVAAGDADTAIIHYERSLHWYLPWSPTVRRAAEALWKVGQEAEGAGNRARAMEAYEALRGAFYATRSFYTPHPRWISLADERIATFQAEDSTSRWPDPTLPVPERKAIALRTLAQVEAPSPFYSFVAVAGFLGWVACALGFMFRAFDPQGRFFPRVGARWGVGILLGYTAWVVGLMRA